MSVERHPGSITGMTDDELGSVAVALVIGELQWSPDVAPAVLDRISRDAVAYPEQFDRRALGPTPRPSITSERSAKRAIGRLAVFGVILIIVIGIVAFAATASVRAGAGLALAAAAVPIRAIDGTLMSFGVDHSGALRPVEQEGRIIVVVTEAS